MFNISREIEIVKKARTVFVLAIQYVDLTKTQLTLNDILTKVKALLFVNLKKDQIHLFYVKLNKSFDMGNY